MGLCKCKHCPQQGKFVEGRYYAWMHWGESKGFLTKGRYVTDEEGEGFTYSPKEHKEYTSCFKEIELSDVFYMSIYIGRKKELFFVPEFRHEAGGEVRLDCFEQLSFPYETEEIGETFWAVWETVRNHPVVSAEEAERATPYYKIITKGKGFRAFSERHWKIQVSFITSENEIIFQYWYRKKGGFGRNTTDRRIERITGLPADNETIGNAILAVFGEAGVS